MKYEAYIRVIVEADDCEQAVAKANGVLEMLERDGRVVEANARNNGILYKLTETL